MTEILRTELSIWALSKVEIFINYNIFKYIKNFLDNKQGLYHRSIKEKTCCSCELLQESGRSQIITTSARKPLSDAKPTRKVLNLLQ